MKINTVSRVKAQKAYVKLKKSAKLEHRYLKVLDKYFGTAKEQTPEMSKTRVAEIERRARKIMLWENKYGAEKAAGMVKEKYGTLPSVYYGIFEDANYHKLNNQLDRNGSVGDIFKSDYSTDFAKYQKAGGRSWRIFENTRWEAPEEKAARLRMKW